MVETRWLKRKNDEGIEERFYPITHIDAIIGYESSDSDNEALEEHINNKLNPHGVTAEQVGAHPNTWMPTVADIGAVNPNLLDNWYFGSPINRNKLTEYSGIRMTIDRWKSRSSSLKTVLNNDGTITLTNLSTTDAVYFAQYPEIEHFESGTYTVSLLVTNVSGTMDNSRYGSIYLFNKDEAGAETYLSAAVIDSSGLFMKTSNIANLMSRVQIQIQKGCSITIKAVKLELGDSQTLAHKDADGNWALNEIPDYANEYIKCIQYDNSTGSYVGLTADQVGVTLRSGTFTGGLSYGKNKTIDLGCTPQWVFFFPLTGSGFAVNGETTFSSFAMRVEDIVDQDNDHWGDFANCHYFTDTYEMVGLIAQGKTITINNGYYIMNSSGSHVFDSTFSHYFCDSSTEIKNHVVASLNGSALTVGNGFYGEINDTATGHSAHDRQYAIRYAYAATYGWIAGL